jgi:diadenylate cyclase
MGIILPRQTSGALVHQDLVDCLSRWVERITMPYFLGILSDIRVRDVLDILFLTALVYHLYVWFWGTKAFKALVGLLVIGIFFTAAKTWGLFLTTWVFQIFWQVLVLLLIILFQSEIRQVLERFNPFQTIGLRARVKTGKWIPDLVAATYLMASRRIGALIVVERTDWVGELVTGGTALEAGLSRELLISLFQKESLLHDGAVLLRGGRISQVGCYLPLSSREGLPHQWGTRHRAALGLTERCDALVVVASEERGEVSLGRDGKMFHPKSPDELSHMLVEAIDSPPRRGMTWWEWVWSLVLHRWPAKIGALLLVSLVWVVLAGQQHYEVTLRVPVELKDLPKNLVVLQPSAPEVEITIQGLRKDASILNAGNVQAKLDLSLASPGTRSFAITRDRIFLPTDRVNVVKIEPTQVTLKFGEKP